MSCAQCGSLRCPKRSRGAYPHDGRSFRPELRTYAGGALRAIGMPLHRRMSRPWRPSGAPAGPGTKWMARTGTGENSVEINR